MQRLHFFLSLTTNFETGESVGDRCNLSILGFAVVAIELGDLKIAGLKLGLKEQLGLSKKNEPQPACDRAAPAPHVGSSPWPFWRHERNIGVSEENKIVDKYPE